MRTMRPKLVERIQGALGFGLFLAMCVEVGYSTFGFTVSPQAMFGFFICAAIPTFIFTGDA